MANVLEQQKYFMDVVIPAAVEWAKTQEFFTKEEIDEFMKAFEVPNGR